MDRINENWVFLSLPEIDRFLHWLKISLQKPIFQLWCDMHNNESDTLSSGENIQIFQDRGIYPYSIVHYVQWFNRLPVTFEAVRSRMSFKLKWSINYTKIMHNPKWKDMIFQRTPRWRHTRMFLSVLNLIIFHKAACTKKYGYSLYAWNYPWKFFNVCMLHWWVKLNRCWWD